MFREEEVEGIVPQEGEENNSGFPELRDRWGRKER